MFMFWKSLNGTHSMAPNAIMTCAIANLGLWLPSVSYLLALLFQRRKWMSLGIANHRISFICSFFHSFTPSLNITGKGHTIKILCIGNRVIKSGLNSGDYASYLTHFSNPWSNSVSIINSNTIPAYYSMDSLIL